MPGNGEPRRNPRIYTQAAPRDIKNFPAIVAVKMVVVVISFNFSLVTI
jgi:hypothetical protein